MSKAPVVGRGFFVDPVFILADGVKLNRQVAEIYLAFVLLGLRGFPRVDGVDRVWGEPFGQF